MCLWIDKRKVKLVSDVVIDIIAMSLLLCNFAATNSITL